ncbi:hypothetical protein FSARC_10375 [Fusarium sarcochroum]|uniref:Uncharacterized protein n=1 Tax=Fusarium sarcochroum TaxID=1208366 RepID=A0A8H4TMQ5_9HYPO|nr:hypothetical protein FSARC_10375 [Fusarium sarcochroum]
MFINSVKAVAILAAVAVATPSPRSPLAKRFTDGEDCTGDEVASSGQAGLFFAVDSNGYTVDCDEAGDASEANGYKCYVSNEDDESLGDFAKCPGDPAPKKNPDGTDVSIGEAIIDTYCKNAGSPAWANIPGCMIFGYYEAQGNPVKEAETGAYGICNTIFSGACTWFTDVASNIQKGMDRPCVDDPGSNACAFANPGK